MAESKEFIIRFFADRWETVSELIRCKDCTKYKHWECPIEQAGYRPKEDGYCFDAERKTDNG